MRPNPFDMEFTEAELQWISEKLKDPNWAKPTRPPEPIRDISREQWNEMIRRSNDEQAPTTTTETL